MLLLPLSACVLVPDLREVVLCTRLTRGVHLRVSCCGLLALAAFPRVAGTLKCSVLPRQPRSRYWSLDAAHDIVSWPLWLPRPDPRDMLSEFEKTREQVLPLPLHS